MPVLTAVLKAGLLALSTLVLLPPHLVLLSVCRNERLLYLIPCLWHRAICALARVKIEIRGEPVTGKQVVFVGNHLSHLDISALGRLLPASFVAKSDVRGWPVFGFLAALARTVFVSRARGDAGKARDTFGTALKEGRSLVLFPEGTSSAGETVLPFKSSLFAPLAGSGITVQPFTLVLLEVDGKKADSLAVRDVYAYYRDMVFAPHLWNFFKGRGARLRLVFHPPLAPSDDRKALAGAAHKACLKGFDG